MKVCLPPDIRRHWLWENPVKFQWWLLLLELAAEEDCVVVVKGEERICHRGECLTTQGKLAKLWGTTPATAQGFLRKLEQMGEVRRNSDAILTQLTICNIDNWSESRRNLDEILTHRRNSDAILTQLNDNDSDECCEVRRNSDAILTQKENEKRKEKESPPHTPYKEKENKKEKEPEEADASSLSSASLDDPKVKIDFVKLAEFWNAKMEGRMIPKIQGIHNDRRTSVMARAKKYGKESIMTVIVKAAASDFLNGENNRSFVATFDWVFRPRNFLKVLEGNFDNERNQITPNNNSNGTTTVSRTNSAEARQQRQSDFAAHIFTKLARGETPGGPTSD